MTNWFAKHFYIDIINTLVKDDKEKTPYYVYSVH